MYITINGTNHEITLFGIYGQDAAITVQMPYADAATLFSEGDSFTLTDGDYTKDYDTYTRTGDIVVHPDGSCTIRRGNVLPSYEDIVHENKVYKSVGITVDTQPTEALEYFRIEPYLRDGTTIGWRYVPIYAEWVQPLGAHDAYKIGDRVIYNNKLYEATIDNNVWAPDVTGWAEVVR